MWVYLYSDEWSPWENTIAYYPFESNAIDVTWNTTLTNSWTQDWLWRKFSSACTLNYQNKTIQYVNMRIKVNSYYTSWNPSSVCIINNLWTWWYVWHNTDAGVNKKIFVWSNSSFAIWWSVSFQPTVWTWHNVSWGYDGAKTIYSIDGVMGILYNWKGYDFGSSFVLVWSRTADVTFSNFILETVGRSSENILQHYNNTKSKYWIS